MVYCRAALFEPREGFSRFLFSGSDPQGRDQLSLREGAGLVEVETSEECACLCRSLPPRLGVGPASPGRFAAIIAPAMLAVVLVGVRSEANAASVVPCG